MTNIWYTVNKLLTSHAFRKAGAIYTIKHTFTLSDRMQFVYNIKIIFPWYFTMIKGVLL